MLYRRIKYVAMPLVLATAVFASAFPALGGFAMPPGDRRDVSEADGDGHRRRKAKDSDKKKKGREKQGKQAKVERSDGPEGSSGYQTRDKQNKKRGRRDRRIADQEEKEPVIEEPVF